MGHEITFYFQRRGRGTLKKAKPQTRSQTKILEAEAICNLLKGRGKVHMVETVEPDG